MIRELDIDADKSLIIDFCYRRERENLFILGNFTRETSFDNQYFGYFDDGDLVGMAAYFSNFGSFVVNSLDEQVINELVDFVYNKGLKIKYVPCFKVYGDIIVKRLIELGHKPNKVGEEIVLILNKGDFKSFETGEERQAKSEDIDELIALHRDLEEVVDGEKNESPVTDADRKKFIPDENFLLKKGAEIVCKANIHGYSKNYFQIGGVVTLPEQRKKGFAKQCISALCSHYFNEGIGSALLFTDKNNIPALKVYEALGFKAVDKFVLARFN